MKPVEFFMIIFKLLCIYTRNASIRASNELDHHPNIVAGCRAAGQILK